MLFDEVFTSDNGKDGLELYKLHPQDLIISDIKCQHLDGSIFSWKNTGNDDYYSTNNFINKF